MYLSIHVSSSLPIIIPFNLSNSTLFFVIIVVGIDVMPYFFVISALSSISTYSDITSLKIVLYVLQGPHHFAENLIISMYQYLVNI
jgi:hypothetical protein